MISRSLPPLILFLLCAIIAPGRVAAQDSRENADFKLAINLYNDGLFDLAAEQLRQFIGSYPNTDQGVEARYYLGLTQLKLNRYEEARLTFQTFALTYQTNPKAAEAWWNVGETYVAVNNYREAALAFERVKVFHPKSKIAPEALLTAGTYFQKAGERDNARRVFRIVLQEYGSSAAALNARAGLARIYFEEGNLGQATSELKRVIGGESSSDAKAQALLILGNIHQSTGKFDEAAAVYQEIVTKYKSTSAAQAAYFHLGTLFASSGQHDQAVENLKKSLALKIPADSALLQQTRVALGDEYVALGNYGEAVTSFEKALGSGMSDDLSATILWKLARAAASGKNYGRSSDACATIIKSKGPESLKRRAQLQLALNAQAQKNYAQAVQQLLSFAEQNPDDPNAGQALYRAASLTEKEMRDPRKAAVLYEALAYRPGRSPLADDALAGSARCNDQLKEYTRSVQLYRDLLERFPATEYRTEAEDRIRMIEIFEDKDKDTGLEKLALLVGDVVADKNRAGLAFRLGEIYFNDLKNYVAADEQFRTAIESGLEGQRARDALYFRARSLEYECIRDNHRRSSAVEAYNTFLQAAPDDPRAVEAALAQFTLQATDLAGTRAAAARLQEAFPSFPHNDAILLRIGTLQEEADSLAAAVATYDDLLVAYPSSPSRNEADFRYIRILFRINLTDTALQRGKLYLIRNTASPYAAILLAQLGNTLLSRGEAAQALEFYRKLTEDYYYTPQASAAQRSLADAHAAMGNYPQALSLYRDLLTRSEENLFGQPDPGTGLLLALGKTEYLSGRFPEAKKTLLTLLSREHTGAAAGEAFTTLGIIARSEGALDAAAAYFRLAAEASPSASATPDVASLLFESGEYTDAIRQYTQLSQNADAEADKRRYESQIVLALLRSDQIAEADKRIPAFSKKYSDTDPERASFELERGSYYFRKKDYQRALKSFQLVLKNYDDTPSAPEAMYWTGKSLEAGNKSKEAIEQLRQLLEEYPTAPIIARTHLALGNLYYNGEKWDESIKHYRTIVDDPTPDPQLLPYAMSNLIETYETAGAYDAALALTRKYLDLYPNGEDNLDKRIKIGILYDRLGYYDQAVLHLQGLIDEAGSDLEGEIRYYIAEANFNKGDYQQAILDFLKVPYLVTKKGKIDWAANSLYMSGQAYEKMGRYDQALAMYQQIIDRPGIDAMFKAAARKEIDRVKLVIKGKTE